MDVDEEEDEEEVAVASSDVASDDEMPVPAPPCEFPNLAVARKILIATKSAQPY
jgi:hypothetical protein